MALTPGAREERKLARKEREAAIKAVEKGEKYGFGPSRRKRDAEVARRMKLFNQDMAASEEDIKRKEAALGFGQVDAAQGKGGYILIKAIVRGLTAMAAQRHYAWTSDPAERAHIKNIYTGLQAEQGLIMNNAMNAVRSVPGDGSWCHGHGTGHD